MSSLLALDEIDRAIGDFSSAFPYIVTRTENPRGVLSRII
jgi:hypothetical protein